MLAGVIGTAVSAVSGAAKSFFNKDAREARKEARQAKKAAKKAAREAKQEAKAILTGGAAAGTGIAAFWVKVKTWLSQNWPIVVAVVAGLAVIYFLFFRKKKGGVRRRSSGRGSSAMKARMARVRAARKRKRK